MPFWHRVCCGYSILTINGAFLVCSFCCTVLCILKIDVNCAFLAFDFCCIVLCRYIFNRSTINCTFLAFGFCCTALCIFNINDKLYLPGILFLFHCFIYIQHRRLTVLSWHHVCYGYSISRINCAFLASDFCCTVMCTLNINGSSVVCKNYIPLRAKNATQGKVV